MPPLTPPRLKAQGSGAAALPELPLHPRQTRCPPAQLLSPAAEHPLPHCKIAAAFQCCKNAETELPGKLGVKEASAWSINIAQGGHELEGAEITQEGNKLFPHS